MKVKSSVAENINRKVIYVIFVIVSLFVLYPLVYVVSAAFSPGNNIASLNIMPFADGVTLKHFKYLFSSW